MACEQLSLNGFIQEMKEVAYGTHPRKFCFVLGAGASRSSGIKSGQELVKIWDKDLRERNEDEYLNWRNRLGITDDNIGCWKGSSAVCFDVTDPSVKIQNIIIYLQLTSQPMPHTDHTVDTFHIGKPSKRPHNI